ncbi:MAG: hypothetical protein WAN65_15540, partial [Candidatus Sulfotelmatobacter sp.]
ARRCVAIGLPAAGPWTIADRHEERAAFQTAGAKSWVIRSALVAEPRSQLLCGLDQYFAEPESSARLQIEHISPMALTLASIRNSQPVSGDTFAQTASSEEIEKST